MGNFSFPMINVLAVLFATPAFASTKCACTRRLEEGDAPCAAGTRRLEEVYAADDALCAAAHQYALNEIHVEELYKEGGQSNVDRLIAYSLAVSDYCEQEFHERSQQTESWNENDADYYNQCRGYGMLSAHLVGVLGHQTAGTSEFLISLAGNLDDQNHSCGTIVNEVNHAVEQGMFECLELDEQDYIVVKESDECQEMFPDILDLTTAQHTGIYAAASASTALTAVGTVATAVRVLMLACRSYVGQI